MHVLGHYYKIVQSIMAFSPVVLQRIQKKFAVGRNLKQSFRLCVTVVTRNVPECTGLDGADMLLPQRLKPFALLDSYGTAEAVPLRGIKFSEI